MQIAIDGPSGAGKSTIAKKLAAHYHILYLDTGAMYRTAALAALRAGIDLHDASQVKRVVDQANIEVRYEEGAQHVYLDGEDVSGKIRTDEVSMAASAVSAVSAVREKLVALQRQTAKKIAVCADAHDFPDYVFADSLEEAIDIAYETAEPGEAVLLSPACASWGMFDNYEQRGDIFKAYVRNLKE